MLTLADIYNTLNPYQWIIRIRNKAFDKGFIKSHTFDLPVICIGNITVGGTGKTPHTEYLIRLLGSRYKVAVLSRGYGRKSKGFVLGDDRATMEKIGDEPFQIKEKFRNVTVAVDEKRVHGILTLLEKDRPQVILLDDAYQHRYVKAGLNILLVDFNRPIWKDSVFLCWKPWAVTLRHVMEKVTPWMKSGVMLQWVWTRMILMGLRMFSVIFQYLRQIWRNVWKRRIRFRRNILGTIRRKNITKCITA
jgi:tetraacyldisaccharide-1-P 4'-kinase